MDDPWFSSYPRDLEVLNQILFSPGHDCSSRKELVQCQPVPELFHSHFSWPEELFTRNLLQAPFSRCFSSSWVLLKSQLKLMDCMKCDIPKAHIQKIFHDPSAPNERYDSRCCWHLWQLWSDFTSPSATANLLSVRLCSACDGRTVPRCMQWNVRAVLWSVLVGKRMKAWWSSFPWFDLGTCNRIDSIMTKDLPSKNLTNILDCFIEHHGRIFISHWSLLCASKKKSHVFCWKKTTTPQKYHGAKRPHH